MSKSFSAVMTGVAVMTRKLSLYRTFSEVMTGVPNITKKVGKSFSAVFTGIPVMTRALIIRRKFETIMIGRAKAYLKITFDIMNRITGGGTTIIKKMINIFDD